MLARSSKGSPTIAFYTYPIKRKYREDAEEQPSNNIDGIMKHAVDSGD